MKFTVLLVVTAILSTSCAALKKPVGHVSNSDQLKAMVKKTPLEIKNKFGDPVSAGWFTSNTGDKKYYVAYPLTEVPVTTLDVMMDSSIMCGFVFFKVGDGYKLADESGVYEMFCEQLKKPSGAQKYEYDDSKILATSK